MYAKQQHPTIRITISDFFVILIVGCCCLAYIVVEISLVDGEIDYLNF